MNTAPLHLMDRAVSVQRRSLAQSADGSTHAAWYTHLASLKVRMEPLARAGGSDDDRPALRRRYKLHVDRGSDILPSDRIIHHGQTLRIIDLLDSGPAGCLMQILAEEESA